MTDKVFVAERGYDYEGFVIIGIYDSREKADAAIERLKATGCGPDSTQIEEFEINRDVDA